MGNDIEDLISLVSRDHSLKEMVRHEVLSTVSLGAQRFSIDSFVVGSPNPEAPVMFLLGGVHGLERIGADLCLNILKSIIERLIWDQTLKNILGSIRLVFIPLLNPVGYYNFTRSNGRGVDLMRNAPVDAIDKTPFLLGGQRLSNRLPWYRGEIGVLEEETKSLISKFMKECEQSQCVVSLDFHSGFGLKDRLWFPYSKTHEPFEHLAEMHAFTDLFEHAHPYHIYQIEPQSHGYLLHGDIWDYLYEKFRQKNSGVFLPLTLEMGSWNWVKKNPWQLISKDGLFNPVKEHRIKRTYRRHHILYDFTLRALYSHTIWAKLAAASKHKHKSLAMERWYEA